MPERKGAKSDVSSAAGPREMHNYRVFAPRELNSVGAQLGCLPLQPSAKLGGDTVSPRAVLCACHMVLHHLFEKKTNGFLEAIYAPRMRGGRTAAHPGREGAAFPFSGASNVNKVYLGALSRSSARKQALKCLQLKVLWSLCRQKVITQIRIWPAHRTDTSGRSVPQELK